MKFTNIQWTHSTINPTSGCDGCELYRKPPPNLTPEEFKEWMRNQPCYASQVHENRWAGSLAKTHPQHYGPHFYDIRTIAGRMKEAAAWGPVTDKEAKEKPWFKTRRRHIFVSDMSDALSREVSFDFLKSEIIDNVTSEKGKRHVWQWLTKRPLRMVEFADWLRDRGIDWPENLWAGTSATTQRTAKARIAALQLVPAHLRFVSFEPMFEEITPDAVGIHWGIIGGASGSNPAAFNTAWATKLVEQFKRDGVATFVKQLGANPVGLKLKDSHGGDWSEWPESLRVREIPA